MSAIIKVLSNCPVLAALILKYVDSSIGHLVLGGMYANEPSVNTAEFKAANEWSLIGITEPKYFLTRSGCFCTASENEQNIIPIFSKSFWNVVATDTESNTASTATPASLARSPNGIPNRSKSFLISGSTSSYDLGPSLGAE